MREACSVAKKKRRGMQAVPLGLGRFFNFPAPGEKDEYRKSLAQNVLEFLLARYCASDEDADTAAAVAMKSNTKGTLRITTVS